jgi:hypothetical protein
LGDVDGRRLRFCGRFAKGYSGGAVSTAATKEKFGPVRLELFFDPCSRNQKSAGNPTTAAYGFQQGRPDTVVHIGISRFQAGIYNNKKHHGEKHSRAIQMKNIQVIDGAVNCSYDIFSVTEEAFSILFPEVGQDMEIIEDVIDRVGKENLGKTMRNVWERPVRKPDVVGIHGTIFYEFAKKKQFYPTKRGSDIP